MSKFFSSFLCVCVFFLGGGAELLLIKKHDLLRIFLVLSLHSSWCTLHMFLSALHSNLCKVKVGIMYVVKNILRRGGCCAKSEAFGRKKSYHLYFPPFFGNSKHPPHNQKKFK